jgi:hypothetical protein
MENGVVKQGRILIILFVSLLSLSFFSCGQSAKGYGVVLWSTDEKLYHAGDVVSIIEDSTVRNSYTFKAPETGDKVETPKFRLMYFKKKKAASDWAKGFEPWKSLFAMTRRDGLAVRSAPDQNADRVYKLRLNEVMKVISKAEKKSAIGDYAGYWYEVLTERG